MFEPLHCLFLAPHVLRERYSSVIWSTPIEVQKANAISLEPGYRKVFPGMNGPPGSEKSFQEVSEVVPSMSNPDDSDDRGGGKFRVCCCSSGGMVIGPFGENEGILSVVRKHMDAFYRAYTEEIRHLHSLFDIQEDPRERTARQTAAGRALWNHVIHDPLANIMAGESHLKNLQVKIEKTREIKSRETAGVMLAVRTLWFDFRLEAALRCWKDMASGVHRQVVILGAGMDTRAYRLQCIEGCIVFEVDLPKVLDFKSALLKCAGEEERRLRAKQVERVAADLASEDWFEKLKAAGYEPSLYPTVWLLEGILYYLRDHEARAVLTRISHNCPAETLVFADFMNEVSTHLGGELQADFHFHSDWPEELLPSLGFHQVRISQMGDPDANFGLIDDSGFFHSLRRIPRYSKSDAHGNPCRRLYLVQCSVAARDPKSSPYQIPFGPIQTSAS